MSETLNIETAIKCLTSIVENLRCGLCDKLDGNRLRFECGHIACEDCVAASGCCLYCLTPPGKRHVGPLVDQPLTRQVKNVTALLDTFQKLFHVNVYRHHRLSEQLKLEKELFPECIQAPSKYFNINKKISGSFKNNSRQSFLPGEFVKETVEMDSFNYVRDWLDKQDEAQIQKKRKPFSDLNINNLRQNQVCSNIIKTRADLILAKVKDSDEQSKKLKEARTHYKTTRRRAFTKNISSLSKPSFKKIAGKENVVKKQAICKNETTESGIDVDTIVIHDSPSEVVDKDKLAWLAVLEADKNKNITSGLDNTDLQVTNESHIKQRKVPFFKRSQLFEVCQLCSKQTPESKTNEAFKPVSISIENDSFRTTITVSHCTSANNIPASKSVSVQTDSFINWSTTYKMMEEDLIAEVVPTKSQDIFTSTPIPTVLPKIQKEVVVLNSDSDSCDGLRDCLVEVTADVHRSCEDKDYGVLTEIDQSVHRHKRPRVHSPTSTNSSEKENCDPNRMKKPYGKKKRKLNYLI